MTKVAIVTDSNSGITQDRGRELGIYVLPMPFFIDGELFLEDITLTQEQFYEKLGADSDISTSQPSPGNVMELWEKVLKEYDEIVCIPMSSGLSSTCFTAMSIAAEYKGRVQVVDNQRISVTQEQSVYDAMKLRDQGMSASDIKEVLEREKLQASIYITVDTLKYLKNLEEAKIIRRLFTDLNSTGDLQKPDKILLDNSNLLHILSLETPEKGTVRETFFCNQLASAGHVVEYGGMKTGDFRIDRKYIIEVGGRDKDFSQIKDAENGYIAADDIDSGIFRKIPLWAFGFLY